MSVPNTPSAHIFLQFFPIFQSVPVACFPARLVLSGPLARHLVMRTQFNSGVGTEASTPPMPGLGLWPHSPASIRTPQPPTARHGTASVACSIYGQGSLMNLVSSHRAGSGMQKRQQRKKPTRASCRAPSCRLLISVLSRLGYTCCSSPDERVLIPSSDDYTIATMVFYTKRRHSEP